MKYRPAIQHVPVRMAEIAQQFEVMQGSCGLLLRDSEGRIAGRTGGYKNTFPGLEHLKDSPATIAKAIRRGKGKVFDRVEAAVREAVCDEYREHLSKVANKAWDTRRRMAACGAGNDGRTAALKAWETRRRNKTT